MLSLFAWSISIWNPARGSWQFIHFWFLASFGLLLLYATSQLMLLNSDKQDISKTRRTLLYIAYCLSHQFGKSHQTKFLISLFTSVLRSPQKEMKKMNFSSFVRENKLVKDSRLVMGLIRMSLYAGQQMMKCSSSLAKCRSHFVQNLTSTGHLGHMCSWIPCSLLVGRLFFIRLKNSKIFLNGTELLVERPVTKSTTATLATSNQR